MQFSYDSSKPLEGILWHLYNSKKIPYSNAVFASSSSQYSTSHSAKNAIDFDNGKYWHAAGNKDPGEYITISTIYPIKLKGYVIQTSKTLGILCFKR